MIERRKKVFTHFWQQMHLNYARKPQRGSQDKTPQNNFETSPLCLQRFEEKRNKNSSAVDSKH
jgi:hypothetical protein